jgi:hypothetical protein
VKRTAIRRKSRLRAKRPTARRVAPDRVRDKAHLAKVRALPCIVGLTYPGCKGPNQASHDDAGKGIGLKTSDLTCCSMCAKHHDEWTNHRGWCRGWSRESRRVWFRAATVATLVELNRQQLARPLLPGEECPF